MSGLGEVKMRVSSGDHEGECRFFVVFVRGLFPCSIALAQEYRVDVTFKVIDGNERNAQRVCKGLGVSDANEESSSQSRP
jgi:hypothetical protein